MLVGLPRHTESRAPSWFNTEPKSVGRAMTDTRTCTHTRLGPTDYTNPSSHTHTHTPSAHNCTTRFNNLFFTLPQCKKWNEMTKAKEHVIRITINHVFALLLPNVCVCPVLGTSYGRGDKHHGHVNRWERERDKECESYRLACIQRCVWSSSAHGTCAHPQD